MIIGRGAPCKDCNKRVLNCHASCERYLSFKKEADSIREKVIRQNFLDRFRRDQIAKWKASQKYTRKASMNDGYWD